MNELAMPNGDSPVALSRPQLSAAQIALHERKVLPLKSVMHGAYYEGLLDDTTISARWHEHRRRFVFWEHIFGLQQLKAAPHVADLGAGPRFAPLARLESAGDAQVSDFAFETAR